MKRSSLAVLAGLGLHFALGYWLGFPFLTDVIAEWIMARTPSAWAVLLLEGMGSWAKPFAATGALAALGGLIWLASRIRPRLVAAVVLIVALSIGCGYRSVAGICSFLIPVLIVLAWPAALKANPSRRDFMTSAAMSSGTILIAGEAWLRNERLAAKAVNPVPLFQYTITPERAAWGVGLVRKPVTPVREFYVMSKNTVDPSIDPKTWRLKLTIDGWLVREFSYAELLSLPREQRFVTLRCVSNTLNSDLMGTAAWSGIRLEQLVRRGEIPSTTVEMAVIGLDGHGDSLTLDYAFSGEPLLALGMNGETLTRNHGFPVRMLTPRYYGFKSIKWIDEIRFTSTAYFGTWPKLGFTKEPLIHTASFIDRVVREGDRVRFGGVSFAGTRGIERVEVRSGSGTWNAVAIEPALSPYALTRWQGELIVAPDVEFLEARARDGKGVWQAAIEKPLFPDGVSGPTLKRLPRS